MPPEQDLCRWHALGESGGTLPFRGLIEDSSSIPSPRDHPRRRPPRRLRGHPHPSRWSRSQSLMYSRHIRRLGFWSMTTLPLSEVKARLSEIAEEVATTHERVQITKNGRDYVVLLAAEDLESIEATLELLSDPDAQSRVARAEEEIERGDVLDEAQVRALLAARRSGSTE